MLHSFLKIVDAINEWVGRITAYTVLPMLGVSMYEVIARYVFKSPTMWAGQIISLLFVILVVPGLETVDSFRADELGVVDTAQRVRAEQAFGQLVLLVIAGKRNALAFAAGVLGQHVGCVADLPPFHVRVFALVVGIGQLPRPVQRLRIRRIFFDPVPRGRLGAAAVGGLPFSQPLHAIALELVQAGLPT